MSAAQQTEGEEQNPRTYSIDLSLELEHQLNNEPDALDSPTAERPHSLDPHVLASIVAQLRTSLYDITKERDDLVLSLGETRSRENGLQDTLDHMTQKYTRMQEELDIANAKIKDDEDAISMLRTKVEESRRGLMRLQTESRRASQVPVGLDLSRATLPGLGGPSSSKRTSFAPPSSPGVSRINSHRRISSVSDANFNLLSSPHIPNLSFPDNSTSIPGNSRRMSGIFGRISPQHLDHHTDDNAIAESESLRSELKVIKTELEEVKHELRETSEAREASETCVKALREFIQEYKVGEQPIPGDDLVRKISNTPAGTGRSAAETHKNSASGGGWGFKLWRGEETTKTAPSNIPVPAPSNASNAPLAKKLGGFFSSRSAPSGESFSPLRQSQLREQVPLYNGLSDTSSVEESVAEPVSPLTTASDFPAGVVVRDVSGPLSLDLGGPDQSKERPESQISYSSKGNME